MGRVVCSWRRSDTFWSVAAYGLAKDRSPSTLNNIAFAALHITVLLTGAWPALIGARREAAGPAGRLTALRADELRGPPIDVAR